MNDVKYGYDLTVRNVSSSSNSNRPPSSDATQNILYLHSYYLSFVHPVSKQRVSFSAEVPTEWESGSFSSKIIGALNVKINQLTSEYAARENVSETGAQLKT